MSGETHNLNNWMLEIIRPYIKMPTIEICSGNGSFSDLLVQEKIRTHMSDPHKSNREKLRQKFQGLEEVRNVHAIYPDRPNFELTHQTIFGSFYTVIALNVREYGYFSKQAFANIQLLLRSKGNLIFIAPARTALYNELVEDSYEWRIYNRRSLKDLLNGGFEILKADYFNFTQHRSDDSGHSFGPSILAVARKQTEMHFELPTKSA